MKNDSQHKHHEAQAKSGCNLFIVIASILLVVWGMSTNPETTMKVFDALGDLFSFFFGGL